MAKGNGTNGNAERRKFILYNSSFREGPYVGHMIDVFRILNDIVKVNAAGGVVVGIGYPDGPTYFPKMDSRRLDSEQCRIYGNMKQRQPKLTYFQRLYMLEAALRGEIPESDCEKFLRQFALRSSSEGSEEFTIFNAQRNRVHILPKFPHILYPHMYDMNDHTKPGYRKDFQGLFEPDKNDIHEEYLVVRSQKDIERIKEKVIDKRDIMLHVDDLQTIPDGERIEELRHRSMPLWTPGERADLFKNLEKNEFDLYVLSDWVSPFASVDGIRAVTPFDPDHLNPVDKYNIDRAIEAAYSRRRKLVIAIPYKQPLLNVARNRKSWEELKGYIKNAGSMTMSPSPFGRYFRLRRHLGHMEREIGVGIYYTFIETENPFVKDPHSLTRKSSSYLPTNFELCEKVEPPTKVSVVVGTHLDENGTVQPRSRKVKVIAQTGVAFIEEYRAGFLRRLKSSAGSVRKGAESLMKTIKVW